MPGIGRSQNVALHLHLSSRVKLWRLVGEGRAAGHHLILACLGKAEINLQSPKDAQMST